MLVDDRSDLCANAFNKVVYLGMKRSRQALSNKVQEPIHFLHIGKCAGTQIAHAIEILNQDYGKTVIKKQPHGVYLRDIPQEAQYFFSIREPLSRFRSGFYSRKRKGMPRYKVEWNSGEAKAFADFEHANDLAEALFEDGERGQLAFSAIRSIRHTARNQVDWFVLDGDFLENRPPLWIIRQERFADDMARLSERLGEDLEILGSSAPKDQTERHSNDYTGVPDFSEKAIASLTRWYAQDIAFYAHCERWLDGQTVV